MGHKTIQVTFRYAHLAPVYQLEAVQRLCNTGVTRRDSTDTRTSTEDLARSPAHRCSSAITPECSVICLSCRDGEIGRRSGLKIRRAQKACGGSIPPPGTNLGRIVSPSKLSGAIAVAMLLSVADGTEGNQIRFGIVSSMASEHFVMHFEVRRCTAELASPPISAEYRQTLSLV